MTSDGAARREETRARVHDRPAHPHERPGGLREGLAERRQALSTLAVAEASHHIVAHLADDPRVLAATLVGPVAMYWPVRGEPDVRLGGPDGPPAPLAVPHGLTLPGHPTAQPELRRWVSSGPLTTVWGRMSYPTDGADAVAPADHGMILVPALAFDRFGNRLGHGAGWYDRLLAGLPDRAEDDGPLLVGIAHGFQLINALKVQPWDVPMHLIITPDSIITPEKPLRNPDSQ